MRNLFLTICVCIAVNMSGCATAGSGSCGTGGCSIFQSSAVRNQPVRDCLRNWFRGDECNQCNAPAGMPTSCGSNTAPLCQPHGSPTFSGQYNQPQPVYSSAPVAQPVDQGVPLYTDPNLNIGASNYGTPTSVAPDYSSNLIDPVFNEGINLGAPTGSIEAGYGEIPMGPSF